MTQGISRRKSIDSSSSSSSDSSDPHKKRKERSEDRKERREERKKERKKEREGQREEKRREKEEKKLKDHKSGHSDGHLGHGGDLHTHSQMTHGYPHEHRAGGEHGIGYPEQSSPPPYVPQNPLPPPSGYRVPLTTQTAFPLGSGQTGPPAFIDADGVSPIFIGSALMENSVHPCKIGPHLNPFASVPYGGGEHGHQGRFDLLPFRHDQMEWVRTSSGRIPSGRKPVEGGYEEDGRKLYHAVATINGVKVPGKTGEHLVGARIPFGGVEHEIYDDYEILCWRY